MKKIIALFIGSTMLVSCSSTSNRKLASAMGEDVTRIGVAMYHATDLVTNERTGLMEKIFSKKRHRATRLYLKEIPEEKGSYYALILEYHKLLKVGVGYGISKSATIADRLGYLNKICKRVHVYKATPAGGGTFDLNTIYVTDNNEIGVVHTDSPSQLILSPDADVSHPLEGAKITASPEGEPVTILFPKESDRENYGFQYNFARLTYGAAKLDSSWRNNFLPGPYLGSYENKNHLVLKLAKTGKGDVAQFIRNKKMESSLTSPKSAEIWGRYNSKKLAEGIFLFTPGNSAKGAEHLEGRLGLFVDIFDASKSLGQDVVELIMTNPNDPLDFLMSYEHPDNGEGKEHR
jgi:hypothetical protein